MEQADCQGAKYWLYSVFEYYSNNILFVFVFGHNSEPEYYSYSYSAKYFCTNIIRIRIRSFWKNEYYSYSYSVKILMPNIIRIRIRSKKQYSLTSVPWLQRARAPWFPWFSMIALFKIIYESLVSFFQIWRQLNEKKILIDLRLYWIEIWCSSSVIQFLEIRSIYRFW